MKDVAIGKPWPSERTGACPPVISYTLHRWLLGPASTYCHHPSCI